MMFTDHKRKLCFPETDNTRRFLLLIFIYTQVNTGREFVQIYGYPALRIKSFGITQVIYQFSKPVRHLIGIRGRLILINFPLLNILLDELTFTHKNSTFID